MKNNFTNGKRNSRNFQIAGLLLFLAGAIAFMGIITSEAFYPSGYSTSLNEISDLGSTRPPESIIHQPSATIFNITMIATGLLIIIGAGFVQRCYYRWIATVPLGLFGIGVLGVGIFPGNMDPYHGIFALTTFVFGGLATITSFRIVSFPFKYIGLLLGAIALVFLFAANLFTPILGMGGTERWVAYPLLIWLIAFGGYLLGVSRGKIPETR